MLQHIIRLVLLSTMLSATSSASFYSKIMQYEDTEKSEGMYMVLQGEDDSGQVWTARNVLDLDFGFIKDVFDNAELMANMGGRRTGTDEHVRCWITEWRNYIRQGSPLSAWVIELGVERGSVGLIIADKTNDPGVCVIQLTILKGYQNKGIGTSVMQAITKIWAPLVRKLALQKNNPAESDHFKCFTGEPLRQLYVSCSPANVGYMKILEKAGFLPKKTEGQRTFHIPKSQAESYEDLEVCIRAKFANQIKTTSMQVDVLYPLNDHEGAKRTVSMDVHKNLKFHFVKDVDN
jgi:RimJ/RimL family protein N-acetyltransferase